jgi:hypothetical protein
LSNHTRPSVRYRRVPLNRSLIFVNGPAFGPTAVSDSRIGLPVRARTWPIVEPKTLAKVSAGRK